MSMAKNGDRGVEVGLEEWGRQQTGQEFHWAPRGRMRVQEGLPIGQEEYRNQCPRREGETKYVQPTSPRWGGAGTHMVTADALPGSPLCQNT